MNSVSSSSSSVGHLLFSNERAQCSVSEGGVVELGGISWQATFAGDDLQLTTVVTSNDRDERKRERVLDLQNELSKRKEDVEALGADQQRVLQLCQEVWYIIY